MSGIRAAARNNDRKRANRRLDLDQVPIHGRIRAAFWCGPAGFGSGGRWFLRFVCVIDSAALSLRSLAFGMAEPIVIRPRAPEHPGNMRISIITGAGSGIGAAVVAFLFSPEASHVTGALCRSMAG
jgi:hypothetical protein